MKTKHQIKSSLLILSFLIFNSQLLIGAVRFVSHTGSSTPPYTSWETAADSIQKCIDYSVAGDTIIVANGVYEEEVVMIPGLSLIGAGMDSCVIDTREFENSTEYQALIMADNCMLKGFHSLVSNNNQGIGIRPNSIDVLIDNNKITNAGIGVWVFNSSSTISNNQILDVSLRGVELEAFTYDYYPLIENNLIRTNQFGVDVFFGTRPTIRNNIIFLNSNFDVGYSGGGSDSIWIYNNLIIAEGSYSNTNGLGNSMVPTFEYNNLVIGDINKGISCRDMNIVKNNLVLNSKNGVNYVDSGNQLIAQYNDAWNNDINYSGFTPDSTNLSVDPMVVSQDSLDFHLQMFSPLIDTGDPNILDIDGSRSDIGLFGGPYGEKYTYRDLAPKPPSNLVAEYDSGLVFLRWNKNTEADLFRYRVYRDTFPNFIYDTTKIVATVADTFYYDDLPEKYMEKSYYYKLTAIDSAYHQSATSEEVQVIITGIPEGPPVVVEEYKLLNNYPNPFNPSTIIPYRLKEGGYVKLYIYDIKGELVKILVNEYKSAGYYEVEFRPNSSERERGKLELEWSTGYNDDVASGVYIYQIIIKNENIIPVFSDVKKMIFLK